MAINKLKQITTRAKSLRKARPGMSWHSAQKAAAAQLRGGGHKRKTHSTAVAKTTHHKKRHTVGSTTIITGKKKRKKKGWFGATEATTNRTTQVLTTGAGLLVGMAGTHMVLRPLEHKGIQMISNPKISMYVAKAMPWAELLGGISLALFTNKKWLRNISLGVAATGAHTAFKQLPIHMHSPAETINGVGEYTQVKIPINGTIRDRINGLIQQPGYTQTPTVGYNSNSIVNDVSHTPTVGRYNNLMHSPTVGERQDDDELLFDTYRFSR